MPKIKTVYKTNCESQSSVWGWNSPREQKKVVVKHHRPAECHKKVVIKERPYRPWVTMWSRPAVEVHHHHTGTPRTYTPIDDSACNVAALLIALLIVTAFITVPILAGAASGAAIITYTAVPVVVIGGGVTYTYWS